MRFAVTLFALLFLVKAASADLRIVGFFLEVEGVLVDEESLQTALYDPAPSECADANGNGNNNGNGNGNGYGNNCDRFLAEEEQDLSFLDEHGHRDLRTGCASSPRICCSLCAGFPDGSSCYIYSSHIADCRYYRPSCCGRRRLEENDQEKPLVQVRELTGDLAEECLDLEGQELHRLEYARLLMKDWLPTSQAKVHCQEIMMDDLCGMKWNDYKDAAGGKFWDDETRKMEELVYKNLGSTCAALRQDEKNRQKALKDAEKAAKDAAKEAQKTALP